MNVAERSIAPEGRAANRQVVANRSPPTAIKVLMPVWGLRYTRQFLEFCLPTMLAPGNVPALAQALPCTFVVMTSHEGRASHPSASCLASTGRDLPRRSSADR